MKQSITFDQLPEVVATILEALERIEKQLGAQSQNAVDHNPNKALNIKEAADFLDLAVPTIYSMVSKGIIPYNKKSKRIYFFQDELIEYLHSGKRKTIDQINREANQYLSVKRKG